MNRKSPLPATGTPSETADSELDAVAISGGRSAPTPSADQKAASAQAHRNSIFTCNYYPPGNY